MLIITNRITNNLRTRSLISLNHLIDGHSYFMIQASMHMRDSVGFWFFGLTSCIRPKVVSIDKFGGSNAHCGEKQLQRGILWTWSGFLMFSPFNLHGCQECSILET